MVIKRANKRDILEINGGFLRILGQSINIATINRISSHTGVFFIVP